MVVHALIPLWGKLDRQSNWAYKTQITGVIFLCEIYDIKKSFELLFTHSPTGGRHYNSLSQVA